MWREIPGVTPVVEKGHKGNSAVETAFLCRGKHDQRDSKTGVSADYEYYYLLWTLYHTRKAILLNTSTYLLGTGVVVTSRPLTYTHIHTCYHTNVIPLFSRPSMYSKWCFCYYFHMAGVWVVDFGDIWYYICSITYGIFQFNSAQWTTLELRSLTTHELYDSF